MTSPRRRRISRRGATLLASAAAVLTIVAVGGLFALRVAEGPSALDLAWIDELLQPLLLKRVGCHAMPANNITLVIKRC